LAGGAESGALLSRPQRNGIDKPMAKAAVQF
jgi:hypothetical protein